MICAIQRTTYRTNICRHTRCSFVVHCQHPFVPVRRIGSECGFEFINRNGIAPGRFNDIDGVAQRARIVDEQVRKLTKAHRQQFIARVERVGQRCLPHTRSRTRKHEYLATSQSKYLRQPIEHGTRELWKRAGPVILHGAVHRPHNAIGHVGGTRDKQEGTSGHGDRGKRWEVGFTRLEDARGLHPLSLPHFHQLHGDRQPLHRQPRLGYSLKLAHRLDHRHPRRHRHRARLRPARARESIDGIGAPSAHAARPSTRA